VTADSAHNNSLKAASAASTVLNSKLVITDAGLNFDILASGANYPGHRRRFLSPPPNLEILQKLPLMSPSSAAFRLTSSAATSTDVLTVAQHHPSGDHGHHQQKSLP
jgi:hypothetical protein